MTSQYTNPQSQIGLGSFGSVQGNTMGSTVEGDNFLSKQANNGVDVGAAIAKLFSPLGGIPKPENVQSTPLDEGTGGMPTSIPGFGNQTVGQPADYYGANSVNPNTGGGSFAGFSGYTGGQQAGGGSSGGAFPLQGQYGIVKMAEGGEVEEIKNRYMEGYKPMSASQIIMNDAHSKEFGAEQVVMAIYKLVEEGKAVLVQHNNSVLVAIQIGDGEVEVHLYTLDNPIRLGSALKYFFDQLRKSDIQKIYGTEMPDKQLIKLMLSVGVPVDKSDKPDYYWMASVQ